MTDIRPESGNDALPGRRPGTAPILWNALLVMSALLLTTAATAWVFGSTEFRGWLLVAAIGVASALAVAALSLARLWLTPERFHARYSVRGRRAAASTTALTVLTVSVLWSTAGLLGDLLSPDQPGFGTLQAIVVLVGGLGIAGAGLSFLYQRRVAPVWLPFVAQSGPDNVLRIHGLQTVSPLARRHVIGGGDSVEILPTSPPDDGARWYTADRPITLFAIRPTAVLMFDGRADSPTRSVTNLVHLAFGCSQGCPPLIGVPIGVSFALVSIGSGPGASAMLGATVENRSHDSQVELEPGPHADWRALHRNIAGNALVELANTGWWPVGRRRRHGNTWGQG